MDLVVDASVVVKWFVEEEDSARARVLMEDFSAQDVELHAPAILPFEILNALRFHPGSTEGLLLSVQAALERFAIREHPFRGDYCRRALHLAVTDDLAVYDAAYLALARELGLKLVTADASLARAAGPDGLRLDAYETVGEP